MFTPVDLQTKYHGFFLWVMLHIQSIALGLYVVDKIYKYDILFLTFFIKTIQKEEFVFIKNLITDKIKLQDVLMLIVPAFLFSGIDFISAKSAYRDQLDLIIKTYKQLYGEDGTKWCCEVQESYKSDISEAMK